LELVLNLINQDTDSSVCCVFCDEDGPSVFGLELSQFSLMSFKIV